MGLVISANGIIQSSEPRNVVSQINADVLALLDVRYFAVDHTTGDSFNQVTVHGNQETGYRYLRNSTNANNPNPPTLAADGSLRFGGTNSIRTNTFDDLSSEFTIALVVKLDAASVSGMIFRSGDSTVSATGKNLYYNSTNQTLAIRQNVTSIAGDSIELDKYITILVSCSASKTQLLINNTIIDGVAVDLTNKYYQLMSSDSTTQPTGNLKYFSFYNGAATNNELFNLQQILKQNFGL